MVKNPSNASYKSRDPAQMKDESKHKLTQKPKKKRIKISAKAPLIQQMPYKGR